MSFHLAKTTLCVVAFQPDYLVGGIAHHSKILLQSIRPKIELVQLFLVVFYRKNSKLDH